MIPIEIPPGVVRNPTSANASRQWRNVNLVRWKDNKLRPVAGWERVEMEPFPTRVRAIHVWTDNNGIERTAYLLEDRVLVDEGGVLTDISPVDPINPPSSDVEEGGYGEDVYNYDLYGTPRPDRPRDRALGYAFTVANWGEDLLVMYSSDNRLLRWSPSDVGSKLARVPNSPLGRVFVVTPERFVIVFATDGDQRRFQWCDQENIEVWNIAVNTKCGEFYVEPASAIVAAKLVKDGVIFWTSLKPYIIRYVGMPYVYSYEEIGNGTTPISAASIIATARGAIWRGEETFWEFNGANIAPLSCPILDWISDDIHPFMPRFESVAVDLTSLSEMWWFFPSYESRENDRYVIYNYSDGWWSMGRIGRTCGFAASYTTYTLMSDGYRVYKHESGDFYADTSELPWAETASLNTGNGSVLSTITQMIPDFDGDVEDVVIKFYGKNSRLTNGPETEYVKTIRPDGFLDVYVTARDIRMRIESRSAGHISWTFGQFLADIKKRGGK